MNRKTLTPFLSFLLLVVSPGLALPLPVGWTLGPGAVGGVSPEVANLTPTDGAMFGYIDSTGSVDMTFAGIASSTTGSTVLSASYAIGDAETLSLDINFLTNDGEDFQDFGFVWLLRSGSPVAVLYTANTTGPFDRAVPAIGGPGDVSPGVILSPSTAVFDGNFTGLLGGIPYGPDKFGSGPGGATGWVTSSFAPGMGTYQLLFAVGNVGDAGLESALVFDNIRTSGTLLESFEGTAVPESSTFLLLSTGLLGTLACGWRRRKRSA